MILTFIYSNVMTHTHTEILFLFLMDSLNNGSLNTNALAISHFMSTNKVSSYLNCALVS